MATFIGEERRKIKNKKKILRKLKMPKLIQSVKLTKLRAKALL
jgi:hypothetical protein